MNFQGCDYTVQKGVQDVIFKAWRRKVVVCCVCWIEHLYNIIISVYGRLTTLFYIKTVYFQLTRCSLDSQTVFFLILQQKASFFGQNKICRTSQRNCCVLICFDGKETKSQCCNIGSSVTWWYLRNMEFFTKQESKRYFPRIITS